MFDCKRLRDGAFKFELAREYGSGTGCIEAAKGVFIFPGDPSSSRYGEKAPFSSEET